MPPLSRWQLYARELPDELAALPKDSSFSLPGAKALVGFADLLGEAESASEDIPIEDSAPFSLPAMLPDDLEGPVSLRRAIDFGALHGDRAILAIDHIMGRGRILLGEEILCTFDSARFTDEDLIAAHDAVAQPCMLAVNLSDALDLGRKETLVIEFDETRPAGLPGPVMLHVTCGAYLSQVSVVPDARQQTVCVSAMVTCAKEGHYVLRVQGLSPDGSPTAAQETLMTLRSGESHPVQISFGLPVSMLKPGIPHAAPAVKIQLFARSSKNRTGGMLCDSATLMCGYAPKTPDTWLPLNHAAAFDHPQKIIDSLKALHIPAVALNTPAPDGLYRALSRAGISVRQYMPDEHPLRKALSRFPCVRLTSTPVPDSPISLEASAWLLCSMVASPRALDETLSPKELLHEASGLPLDPKEESVHNALLWLRALSVRLRAEGARQSRYHGALCEANEQEHPDVSAALRTAFAPLHLSALPLCGAWWTGTRFSAALEAFVPDCAYESGLRAQAVLEDGEGLELARLEAPCLPSGGYIGVIEATLPDHPCVLELTTRLLSGNDIVEESMLPIYVGERGQLESAFL